MNLIALFLPLLVGQEATLSYGVGLNKQLTDVKQAQLSLRGSQTWDWRGDVGVLADRYDGATGYAFASYGPRLNFGAVVIESSWGLGLITHPDSQLGGVFQFTQETGFSFHKGNDGIGAVWKHISSAGIYSPNKGRDALMIQWKVSF